MRSFHNFLRHCRFGENSFSAFTVTSPTAHHSLSWLLVVDKPGPANNTLLKSLFTSHRNRTTWCSYNDSKVTPFTIRYKHIKSSPQNTGVIHKRDPTCPRRTLATRPIPFFFWVLLDHARHQVRETLHHQPSRSPRRSAPPRRCCCSCVRYLVQLAYAHRSEFGANRSKLASSSTLLETTPKTVQFAHTRRAKMVVGLPQRMLRKQVRKWVVRIPLPLPTRVQQVHVSSDRNATSLRLATVPASRRTPSAWSSTMERRSAFSAPPAARPWAVRR